MNPVTLIVIGLTLGAFLVGLLIVAISGTTDRHTSLPTYRNGRYTTQAYEPDFSNNYPTPPGVSIIGAVLFAFFLFMFPLAIIISVLPP